MLNKVTYAVCLWSCTNKSRPAFAFGFQKIKVSAFTIVILFIFVKSARPKNVLNLPWFHVSSFWCVIPDKMWTKYRNYSNTRCTHDIKIYLASKVVAKFISKRMNVNLSLLSDRNVNIRFCRTSEYIDRQFNGRIFWIIFP